MVARSHYNNMISPIVDGTDAYENERTKSLDLDGRTLTNAADGVSAYPLLVLLFLVLDFEPEFFQDGTSSTRLCHQHESYVMAEYEKSWANKHLASKFSFSSLQCWRFDLWDAIGSSSGFGQMYYHVWQSHSCQGTLEISRR